MATSLIEAIKSFKEKQSKIDKILVQNVEWDLDSSFIGEPMAPRVLKRLSQYVDKKLIDYSSIQGSEAATNMPRAQLQYNESDQPPVIDNKKIGVIFPALISQDQDPNIPIKTNFHTDYVDGNNLDENDFPTEEESIEVYRKHNTSIYGLRVHPKGSDTDGVTVDDPDFFDASGVNINLEPTETEEEPDFSEYDEYSPHLETYIPEDVAAIEDEHVDSECIDVEGGNHIVCGALNGLNLKEIERTIEENSKSHINISKNTTADEHIVSENNDIEEKPHYSFRAPGETNLKELEKIVPQHTDVRYQTQSTEDIAIEDEHVTSESEDVEGNPKNYYGSLNGTNLDEIERIVEEAKKPPSHMVVPEEDHYASYYINSNGQLRDEITEKESEANAIEADMANSGDIMFQATPNPGLNMGMDHHVDMAFGDVIDTLRPNGMYIEGVKPTDFTPFNDEHVYAHGALPSVRIRVRDSFIRNRNLSLKIPQFDTNIGKEVSYVTSYTIEHQSMKIKARVITAPVNQHLEDDLWFELCCSGGDRLSTKDMIKDTVKANLCIIAPTRGSVFPKMMKKAEKTALETLRDMITEQEYRNYIRYGFITVKGKSGRLYQISRTLNHTKVWDHGELVEEGCVRIKGGDFVVPETDNIIAFKVMIETDENLFKSLGNVYKVNYHGHKARGL